MKQTSDGARELAELKRSAAQLRLASKELGEHMRRMQALAEAQGAQVTPPVVHVDDF